MATKTQIEKIDALELIAECFSDLAKELTREASPEVSDGGTEVEWAEVDFDWLITPTGEGREEDLILALAAEIKRRRTAWKSACRLWESLHGGIEITEEGKREVFDRLS